MDENKNNERRNWSNNATPSNRTGPPIWPGVYVWLLVGVIVIIYKLIN